MSELSNTVTCAITILETEPDCPDSPAEDTGGEPCDIDGEPRDRTLAVEVPEPPRLGVWETPAPEVLAEVAVRVRVDGNPGGCW